MYFKSFVCDWLPDLFCITKRIIDCIIKDHRYHLWILSSASFVVEFKSEGPVSVLPLNALIW